MALFSERYNLVEKTKLQKGSLEQGTRNLLWNEMLKIRNGAEATYYYDFVKALWCYYLKQPYDNIPKRRHINEISDSFLRDIFMNGEYYRVFDVLELAVNSYHFRNLLENCNGILKKENCAYRFVDKFITEITSDIEIQEVDKAVNSSNKNTRAHLEKALEHLSDRQNPDYRNSIKESISAVEALCRNITGESTLDRALNKLESKGVVFNSQLKQGLEKIYYYTNGEDGIRHALMDAEDITKADAKFMLVMCSAFINYIRENGING